MGVLRWRETESFVFTVSQPSEKGLSKLLLWLWWFWSLVMFTVAVCLEGLFLGALSSLVFKPHQPSSFTRNILVLKKRGEEEEDKKQKIVASDILPTLPSQPPSLNT